MNGDTNDSAPLPRTLEEAEARARAMIGTQPPPPPGVPPASANANANIVDDNVYEGGVPADG